MSLTRPYPDEDDVADEETRSDVPVVRHLCRIASVGVAREWQTPPLLVVPTDAVADLAAAGHVQWVPDLEHLPWDDVVIDAGDVLEILGHSDGRDRHAWMRVRTAEAVAESLGSTSPWLRDLDRLASGGRISRRHMGAVSAMWQQILAEEGSFLIVEYWDEALIEDGARTPFVSLIDRREPDLTWRHVAALPAMDRALYSGARLAVAVLSVFTDPPVYVVERRSARSPRIGDRRAMKTARLKPWLRTDLPSLILVDPSRVDDYGHPSTTGGGERSSPRLHARRGHWRTLHRGEEDERKTWVRPTWVGADAWDHQGTHYQLAQMPARVAVERAKGIEYANRE